jgi:hypothetical protein
LNRSIALLGALAGLALLATGCGGSDDGTTTASLTKAEFVKQGNAICQAGNEEINSEVESFAEENGLSGNDQPTAEQLEELATDILIPSVSKQVGEVRDLGAPSGAEQEADRFLNHAEKVVEEVEADPTLVTEVKTSPFESVNKEAAALGLTVCAQET